jgi:hypothetical protein
MLLASHYYTSDSTSIVIGNVSAICKANEGNEEPLTVKALARACPS